MPATGRAILGLWGLGAGLLLWTGRRVGIGGWPAIMAWTVIQIPVVAWDTDGSLTTQLFDVPLSASSRTTVNGEVTSYSEYGINLVGVVLTVWAVRTRGRWDRHVAAVDRPAASTASYEITLHPPGRAPRILGTVDDLEMAQRAAASQVAGLRRGGEQGEVVVIERPSGREMAREILS